MAPASANSVLLLRFSAAGDVMLCSHAIAALARAWPQARLIFVTHARFAALLRHDPRLYAVEALPPGGSVWALLRRLRARYRPDAVLDLHGSWRSQLLYWGLPARRRARFCKRSWRNWARVRLAGARYRPEQTLPARLHAAAERLVGGPIQAGPLQLWGPPAAVRGRGPAADPWGATARPGATVGLSPGAGWRTKRWPVAAYGALARAQLALGRRVVLLGSAGERPLTQAIARAAPGCLDLAGQLSWADSFAQVAALDVLVTGDTGPMHLARGLGTKVVALFLSTPASQFDLRGHVALSAAVACSPCSFYGRPSCPRGHAACLTAVDVATVCRGIDSLLGHAAKGAQCLAEQVF